jgi:4-amino-4-deoxy-L-arabinose transferase-like glycosyltransferase
VTRALKPIAWIGAIAGLVWIVFPLGFLSYDTWYAIVWGDELAHGMSPDYGASQPPTPHPLGVLWSAVLSPLGAITASNATIVLAYLALGAVGYLVYRLGAEWFDSAIGVAAAAIVLTRAPFLEYGLRCSPDLVYIALVLCALLVESRRRRAGWPVLALLAGAGLIRPEAWLFSGIYLAYLALEREPGRERYRLRRRADLGLRELAGWVAIAAAAPLGWLCFDLITTGNPLYSFTATHDRVKSLERHTGFVELFTYGPRQLATVIQGAVLVAAPIGLVLGFALLRRRAMLGIVAAVLAGIAFAMLSTAGFSIIDRYTMLGSAVLCIFAALALLGWRLLPRDDRWRRRWQLIALGVATVFVVQAPQQYDFVSQSHALLQEQKTAETDLHSLATSAATDDRCRPLAAPTDRSVPRLAAWYGERPTDIVITTEQGQPTSGYFFKPVSAGARLHFGSAPVPPGFRPVARNESWALYARCGRGQPVALARPRLAPAGG